MEIKKMYSENILNIENPDKVVNNIIAKLRKDVFETLKRQGGVVGISGGIDSSVTLALAVKAFGADKIIGVMLPEKDSSTDSKELALMLADKFRIQALEENITRALEGFGCYP